MFFVKYCRKHSADAWGGLGKPGYFFNFQEVIVRVLGEITVDNAHFNFPFPWRFWVCHELGSELARTFHKD